MKRLGFTLIELLVVIAVIALLMSLTTTVLRMSREQAKAVLCRSNVRQLAFGLFIYAGENETFPVGFRNTFPVSDDYLGSAVTDHIGRWWLNYIEDFVEKPDGEKGVFCCPSKNLGDWRLRENVLWGNYGVNRSICRTLPTSRLGKRELTGTPLGPGGIPHPSRTLLIVDSGYGLVDWWRVTDTPPWPPGSFPEDFSYVPGIEINASRDLLPGQLWDAITGRHPNKTVNVGFADGQVRRMKAQDLLVENTAGKYKNKTPLWAPK